MGDAGNLRPLGTLALVAMAMSCGESQPGDLGAADVGVQDTNVPDVAPVDVPDDAQVDAPEPDTTVGCGLEGFAPVREETSEVPGGGRHFELLARSAAGDAIRIQWWPPGVGPEGTFALGPADASDCASASGACILAYSGCDEQLSHCDKTFVAQAGTLDIGTNGDTTLSGNLRDLLLVEASLASDGSPAVVTDGATWCLASYAFEARRCRLAATSVAREGAPAACELKPEPEADARATFDALTASLDTPLALPDRAEDTYGTIGTLALGLHPHVVPIVTSAHGTLVAASTMGSGRVVAFAGQDFLSSYDRSTLLGHSGVQQLLANATRWASNARTGRILVDNPAVRDVLAARGISNVDVVASNGDVRDWSVDLSGYASVVVQVNEWGTSRIAAADIEHLRAFVQDGGGLLIAGSALHWDWWLTQSAGEFAGNVLLTESNGFGAGIRWNYDSFLDIADAVARFDSLTVPLALWDAYVHGAPVARAGYVALAPLFVSALDLGLDIEAAIRRLVDETPALPATAALPAVRLSATVIATLPPYRWPVVHPWAETAPGLVASDVPRLVGHEVTIDRRWVGPVPLGLYVPPGEVVTVAIPSGAEDIDLQLQVGERHDELESISDVTTWQRAPHMYREFKANQAVVSVGSALGGTLYALLPEGDADSGTLVLTVTGAVAQPWYVAGRTTPEEWATSRALKAPQAVLELPGKVHLVVATDAVRDVQDPAAILRYWEGFFDSHFALSQEPVPRRRASHLLFDIQVGWGYANATSERIDFPKVAEAWALRRDLDNEDVWLFGHELGHQFQTSNWTGDDITEVAVNLFTMYTLNGYVKGGGDRETRGHKDNVIDHAALASARWPSADLFGKLELYRQLVFEFGWSTYKQVFASYYSPDFSEAEDGVFMDGFAIRFSKVVQRDLSGFFDHWQYPLSDSARARIKGLGLSPWLPPGW